MTELKLSEALEEQAIAHALGILSPEDRQAFMVRLQKESDLLPPKATEYHVVTDALSAAVVPVTPPATIRERLVSNIALEAAREDEQFELVANTLATGAAPAKPRDSVRGRLLSQIERHADAQCDLRDSVHTLGATLSLKGDGLASEKESRLPQDLGSLSYWVQYCRTAVSNALRTLVIRVVTSERVRYWKAKMTFQQPIKGLTFIKAAEGVWRGIAPGVTAKILSFDPVSRRITTLLRFAPGTSYAPHRHTEVEELYVLQGGCSIAGHAMTVGDYHRAEAGTEHYDTSTDDGCLLLVISSPQNEILR